jgi:DNA transformation protein and related proteins
MRAKNRYLDFVIEWLSPLGEITARAMFGGYCLYCDGIVFALVADDTLYLKVDAATRPRFESHGLKPFRPFADRPKVAGHYPQVMQYYPPPAEFFEDPAMVSDWGRAAVEAGLRVKSRKKTARR